MEPQCTLGLPDCLQIVNRETTMCPDSSQWPGHYGLDTMVTLVPIDTCGGFRFGWGARADRMCHIGV